MGITKQRDITTPMDIVEYTGIPFNIMQADAIRIAGAYSDTLLEDLARIIRYYKIYDDGVQFLQADGGSEGDYLPADLQYARSASLIDKEARFMFGKPAEFKLTLTEDDTDNEQAKEQVSDLQNLLDEVLRRNSFPNACIKAFKDCCIGERVAVVVDFNEDGGITIRFLPSYSFVYETDEFDRLKNLVTFYNINDEEDVRLQRIYRKHWYIENGACYVEITVYDGSGQKVAAESQEQPTKTEFDYIPGFVVLNDGLTGDLDGVSEIKKLGEYEYWYSKLANADIDAQRQGMNPIRYAIDMSPESTDRKNLAIKPGAFWDMSSDTELEDGKTGTLGILEPAMSYSDPLSKTLDRLSTSMNETVDVPNINADSMTGVITSGKSLKAIYWPLTVRCDEKMLSWKPALEFIAHTIIDGCRRYKNVAKLYMENPVPDVPYVLTVENPYSLPEDEIEEKNADMAEVTNKVRSRKSYMMKWHGYTDKDADAELQQIAFEEQLFSSGYSQRVVAATNSSVVAGVAQQTAQAEQTAQGDTEAVVQSAKDQIRNQIEGNAPAADTTTQSSDATLKGTNS